jgi:uncharacterized protein (DUF427 family)
MKRDQLEPGQESVWDYPRPPRLEASAKTVRVLFGDHLIAESTAAYRVLETSHPPSWYIPRAEICFDLLSVSGKGSVCEWKGRATYWKVRLSTQKGLEIADNAAWSYESPNPRFEAIKGYLAFYPNIFACFVDGERVRPQPGGFYGGWITHDVAGPFKGIPGSWGW